MHTSGWFPAVCQSRKAILTLRNPTIRSISDIDGDGKREIVYASPSSGREFEGKVWALSSTTDSAIWQVVGDRPNAQLGTTIVVVSDQDGDAVEDLLVGAVSRNVGENERKASFALLSGRGGGVLRTLPLAGWDECTGGVEVSDLDADGSRDVLLCNRFGVTLFSLVSGREIHAFRGWADTPFCTAGLVGGPGDVKGRVIVGEPGGFAGRCHLVSLKDASLIKTFKAQDVGTEGTSFGAAVVGTPDVDGDELGEFAASDPAFFDQRMPGVVILMGSKEASVLWKAEIPRQPDEMWGCGLAVVRTNLRSEMQHYVVVSGVLVDGIGLIALSLETGEEQCRRVWSGLPGTVGSGVTNIGDLTGDGIDDLAVCASDKWSFGSKGSDTAVIVSGANLSIVTTLAPTKFVK
jgi:hypothetical protein